MQFSIPYFMHLSQVALKQKIVFIFSYILLMFEHSTPLEWGHFGPWDLGLNNLGKGPLGNVTYLISSIWGKGSEEKDFSILSTYFNDSNLGLSGAGHFGLQGHHLNKLGRGPLGNATYYISNIWAYLFWKRRMFNLFIYFYGLNLEPLMQGHLGPSDLCLNKLCKGVLGMQCYIQNFIQAF